MVNIECQGMLRRRQLSSHRVCVAVNCTEHSSIHPVLPLGERATQAGDGILNGFAEAAGSVAGVLGRSAAETKRAMRFWSTVLAIWGRFKVTQMRAKAAEARGDMDTHRRLWAFRHAHEAEVMWRLCVGMRVSFTGIFLSSSLFARFSITNSELC